MSERIERQEHRHVNVKVQDSWRILEHSSDSDAATVVLEMNPPNAGCRADGRLYLNENSLDMLEDLGEQMIQFTRDQRRKNEERRRQLEAKWCV
jgi:hypothetical protein